MKFILSAATGKLEQAEPFYIGPVAPEGSFIDMLNDFSQWTVDHEMELILKPIGIFLQEIGISLWHWFLTVLPDIMGYTTIAAGVFIILSSLIGKGGMMKTLGWYVAALIFAFCVLGSV